MTTRMKPGNNCCSSCTIFKDTLNANNISSYTQVSGSWSEGAGGLTTTSSGAVLVSNTAGTTGHGRVEVTGKVNCDGCSFRLIGSYVDANNYLYVELVIHDYAGTFVDSTFTLYKRVSGVDTQIGTQQTFHGALNTNYHVSLCWNGKTAIAYSSTIPTAAYGSYTGTGNKGGLGASLASGTATFTTLFLFEKLKTDDATCTDTCSSVGTNTLCCSGPYPQEMQVDLSGFGTLDGTYVLQATTGCFFTITEQHGCGPCYRVTINFAYAEGAMVGGVPIMTLYADVRFFTNGGFSGATVSMTNSSWTTATPCYPGPFTVNNAGPYSANTTPGTCANNLNVNVVSCTVTAPYSLVATPL